MSAIGSPRANPGAPGPMPPNVTHRFSCPGVPATNQYGKRACQCCSNDPKRPWRRLKRVHDYLDGLPEVGKVLSLASAIRIAEEVNGGEFDGLEKQLERDRDAITDDDDVLALSSATYSVAENGGTVTITEAAMMLPHGSS